MAQAIHVVPKMPVRAPRFLGWAKAVNARLKGHATFTSPNPTLADLIDCVEDLDDAETDAHTRAGGAATVRDDKLEEAKRKYRHLVDYVQSIVETLGYLDALAAAESIGFALRKPPTRNKQAFEVRNGRVSGEVELIAKAVAYLAMYYWEMSEDEEHWTALPETHQASTTVSGLTPGKVYYFRFRTQKRRGGKSDPSQIVSFRVP